MKNALAVREQQWYQTITGMLPSVSAKLIRRKVCEKNSVFCCVLAVEMLQDGKPTLIYAIVCKKPEENFAKENFMGYYFC